MIVVVGAGPIGIEMVIALKRNDVPHLLLESGALASTVLWYAPGTEIFSSPQRLALAGVPFEPLGRKATREDYLLYLRTLIRQYRPEIRTNRRVRRIHKLVDGFSVEHSACTSGVGGPETAIISPLVESVSASTIILATGNMNSPRLLNIPGENEPFVSHYLGEIHRYAQSKVTIVGAGNSAAEAALRLFHSGAEVTLVQRGEGFNARRIKPWLLPELEGLIREQKIRLLFIDRVLSVTHGTLEVLRAEVRQNIESHFIFFLSGYRQDTTLFTPLGITLEGLKQQPTHDIRTMETNIPGVYVIGTAAVGTESGGVTTFIENSHIHVHRVLAALGYESPFPKPDAERSESAREI